ncbi:MAG TPA: 2-C-methyl-D-erythritol 2,4-cyclodiphosphate synthase [Burkholderiales bacterium]|nr:2-C-methyl-D-erythritol 2,4-cyclodiphosphate synthase [Burkholderiales bacterium]
MLKIGLGYDIHPLVAGRPLVLGGLSLPGPRGLAGHSDGDALVHAIIDALLGAAGLGDIGQLYPDTDPRTEGASSLGLLGEVMGRLRAGGWSVVNVDAVVAAEEPKIAPLVGRMKKALCPLLGVGEAALGIKGKTNEGLGPVGEARAIACWAVALIQKL